MDTICCTYVLTCPVHIKHAAFTVVLHIKWALKPCNAMVCKLQRYEEQSGLTLQSCAFLLQWILWMPWNSGHFESTIV